MTLDELRSVITDVIDPRYFWAANGHRVFAEHRDGEEMRWEVFRGHLLPPAQTRETRTFEAWHLFHESAKQPAPLPFPAPLISILRDLDEPVLYVTRGLLLHGWEAFESSPGVIASRPQQLWSLELVGTLTMLQRTNLEALGRELQTYLDLAIRGVSRLPITSLESPLPEFALGQLCYVGESRSGASGIPFEGWSNNSDTASLLNDPRWFEFAIRSSSAGDMPSLTTALVHAARRTNQPQMEIRKALLAVFNNTSLTPYTGFADRLFELLTLLSSDEGFGACEVLSTVATMLRLLTRHLTAFDLQRFHSLGANYPDALVLDGLLRLLLTLCEQSPNAALPQTTDDAATLKTKQRIRRALRQAWLLRKQYEQLAVPDAPTSLGENQRVLPVPFFRVPEEQILQPQQRTKRLFVDETADSLLRPAVEEIWRLGLAELSEPSELLELGTALYLDRPLGIFKSPGETDRTPLLSYEAFSRTMAESRLRDFRHGGHLETNERLQQCLATLNAMNVGGIPVTQLPNDERPGVVALSDARKAADDFVFRTTTRGSLSRFIQQSQLLEFAPTAFRAALNSETVYLLIRTATATEAMQGKPFLTAFDAELKPVATLSFAEKKRMPPILSESHGVEFFFSTDCWQN